MYNEQFTRWYTIGRRHKWNIEGHLELSARFARALGDVAHCDIFTQAWAEGAARHLSQLRDCIMSPNT